MADEEALEKIKTAASSVGLTPEQLADLITDSGAVALPPTDDVTEKYTLEDLGKRLWGCMQIVPRDERTEWFDKLSEPQQIAVVVVLKDRGFRSEIIRQELGIPMGRIQEYWHKHCDNLGGQVVGIRLNTIAGQMELAAQRAQEMAMNNEDASAYWRIEKERIGVLQSLGIVDKAIHKVEHTHKFEDQQKAEIEAMLELERKQLKRQEEIKQIEAKVIDALPEMEDLDDG